jgi:hypothetical protein
MNNYSFGQCNICNKFKPIKDGICGDCVDKNLPDFFKDLFESKPKEYNA